MIEWTLNRQHVQQELVSKDERWHIRKEQTGGEPPDFFLTNYDLLVSPHGTGDSLVACLESFAASCDDFIRLATAARNEAKANLEQLGNLQQ